MLNAALFPSHRGRNLPTASAVNRAGAPAYALAPRHALAQLAATGSLSQTYYATEVDQLSLVLRACDEVGPEWVAKVAVYARQRGFQKDWTSLTPVDTKSGC